MQSSTTRLLLLLIVAGLSTAGIAASRLSAARDRAFDARRDLATARNYLSELTSKGSSGLVAPAPPDLADVTRRIHAAAIAAGISEEHLPSIEPRRPMPVENTNLRETTLFLGFDSLTLRQTLAFLHQMISHDPHCRVQTIEFSIPEDLSGAAATSDAWRVDLELSYLTRPAPGASPPAPPDDEVIP